MTGNGSRIVQLGALRLIEVIGRGGMGEVWRAEHPSGLTVAVKVVSRARGAPPRLAAMLRNELRAVATLDHPSIVTLLDHGLIDEDQAEASRGRLVAGSPYLVMELCADGTLEPAASWDEARELLLELLEALAHAHALGVLHRDLKPSNVLRSGDQRRITDFSIARPSGEAEDLASARWLAATGTPHYMAPEQVRGQDWRQGPATDLYALGCLGWWLVSGHPPFAGVKERKKIHLLQLEGIPPRLAHRIAVPLGFEGWLRVLLHKEPRGRFELAAEARQALLALGPPELEPSSASPEASLRETGLTATAAKNSTDRRPAAEGDLTEADVVPEELHPAPRDPSRGVRRRPRGGVPESWRGPARQASGQWLQGAGIRLFGLRRRPLVGREEERDRLWALLREVHEERRPGVVILEGDAGVGKSALAGWLARRAHELGAGLTLRCGHGPSPGEGHGIPAMLRRLHRADEVPLRELARRLRHHYACDPALGRSPVRLSFQVGATLELMQVTGPEGVAGEGGPARVNLPGEAARGEALRRILEEMSGGRPILLWIDDAQWAQGTLSLVGQLLRRPGALRLLVILTLRSDLPPPPSVAAPLEEIRERAPTETLRIEPLDPAAASRLVEEMLQVAPALAEQVVQRTEGNPLFAVQLVGDWVQRGLLRWGNDRFELESGVSTELPRDIFELWTRRIEEVLAPLKGDAGQALELAALLGPRVEQQALGAALEAAGLEDAPGLVPALLERGLALGDETAWSFAHTMLRERCEESARQEGRLRSHHAACFEGLGRVGKKGTPGLAERRGRHALAAGRPGEAVEHLLAGAAERGARGRFDAQQELFDLWERALEEDGAGPEDARFVAGWIARGRAALKRRQKDEAAALADRLEAFFRAAPAEHRCEQAEVRRWRGAVAMMRGRFQSAREHLLAALEIFEDAGDIGGVARVSTDLGNACYFLGEIERAIGYYADAAEKLEALGDDDARAGALRALGARLVQTGKFAEARVMLERAAALREAGGNRHGLAYVLNDRGELERAEGRLAAAEEAYARASEELESMGDPAALVSRLNLALVSAARGEAEVTLRRARSSLTDLLREGNPHMAALAAAILGWAAASLGQWAVMTEAVAEARAQSESTGSADQDARRLLEETAGLAEKAGRGSEASAARSLAALLAGRLDAPA